MRTARIKTLCRPSCEWNHNHFVLNFLHKLALLQVLPKQFRVYSVGVKVKKSQPDVFSSLVINPMLEKLSRKVRETTMRMEIKKKAAKLAQIKRAVLKMKEK